MQDSTMRPITKCAYRTPGDLAFAVVLTPKLDKAINIPINPKTIAIDYKVLRTKKSIKFKKYVLNLL